ncbi:MAG TPA: c-type cytochrome domain-containing protein [Gemmataceae bacterium]|nr:c-type cytochrome domain-containing protein [Gemmataceae bacterium]
MLRSRYCLCVLCVTLGAVLALMLFFLAPRPAGAADPQPAATAPVSFINDVAPILKENCFGCHGAKNPKGKLDMTKFASFQKGGTKDAPFHAGQPDASLVIDLLKGADTRMPPKDVADPLPPAKIAVIEQWIKEGAKLDAGIDEKADLVKELCLRWTPPVPPITYAFPVTVTALAFTPDGKQVVASGHHELTVWDASTGKLVKRIRTRARRALAMVFLPDGKLAVAGGRPGEEGDVRVYDINGGTPKTVDGVAYLDGVDDKAVMLKQLLDADDEVLCLALSPDGKKLASGGCDRIVNVWDISGGALNAKLEQSIENHADWVFALAFSADDKFLVTGSRDKTAKMWDLEHKESVLTFPDHQAPVYGVAIKPDGKTGFSAGDDNQVRAWNTQGDQAAKQTRTSGGHGKTITKLVVVPKQPLLVTASADDTVRIWNEDNGSAVKTLSGHTDYVYALAVSPDGTQIASGSFNGEVKIWKTADGSAVKAFNASPGLAAPAPPTPPK